MKHIRNIVIALLILPFELVMELLGLVVVPIALLGLNSEQEHLPRWAWPWDNDEDGINGDGELKQDGSGWGWRGPEHAKGRERMFWWRFRWLALRNKAHNFGRYIGVLWIPGVGFSSFGNSRTSNQCEPGFLYRQYRYFFCYYWVWKWADTRSVRVLIGWKLNGPPRGNFVASYVFSVNPWSKFKRIC